MADKSTINWNTLDFATFEKLARDPTLSKYEKIGFPDSYRAGFEQAIFEDIRSKILQLDDRGRVILDIGPGCSDLPQLIIEHCRVQEHRLVLLDSAPMLDNLPNANFVDKRPGMFPRDASILSDLAARIDIIICYSVFHYVFSEANPFDFIDAALELLGPGGTLLIGDIPNISKRRRFFASDSGVAFHRAFTGTETTPEVEFNMPARGSIDDAALLGLLARARAAGADAYIVPQPPTLPMSNRREDIIIRKP